MNNYNYDKKEMHKKKKPRFLHVFYPGQGNNYLGDLNSWVSCCSYYYYYYYYYYYCY